MVLKQPLEILPFDGPIGVPGDESDIDDEHSRVVFVDILGLTKQAEDGLTS